MNKTTKYARNLAVAGAIINAALNLIKQLGETDNDPTKKVDWKNVLVAGGKGALAGAAIGGVAGALCDYENSLEEPQNTDAFLRAVVSRIKLNTKDNVYKKLEQRAEQLSEVLTRRFEDKFSTPIMRGGSTTDGTALHAKFDIDLFVSFKPRSFRSTREMFDQLYSFLQSQTNYYGISEIRDQKKSIGVIFTIKDEEFKIDVVPKKMSGSKRNKTSGYLFVNNPSIWGDNSTYTKTDFRKLRSLTLTPTQRQIVVVLKHWKNKYDLPLGSHLLKNLVLDAYACNRTKIPKLLTKKIIMVLEHIVENLDIAVIRSVENTNNVLTNISADDKAFIIDACKSALEDYNYQPNSILTTFA